MNKQEQMKKYDNPDFWAHVIKIAKQQAAPVRVVHHYRPIGLLLVLSFLVLGFLLDHNVPVVMAVLTTMLVALLTVIFS